MLKVKVVYDRKSDGDRYEECSVSGIMVPDYFCCLLFKDEMPKYLYNEVMEEFLDIFNSKITDEVYRDIEDSASVVIYMRGITLNMWQEIYRYNVRTRYELEEECGEDYEEEMYS